MGIGPSPGNRRCLALGEVNKRRLTASDAPRTPYVGSNRDLHCPRQERSLDPWQFSRVRQKWADHIIVGDHNSDDGSGRIAQDFGCQVVPLRDPSYDESIRRRVLIEEARRISKRALIISIDADEMLSANWSKSAEWSLMRRSPPGTSFHFDWLELLPCLGRCVVYGMTAAFVDDGTDYTGQRMHSPRIPCLAGADPSQ